MTLQNNLQRAFFRYLEAINSEYWLWEDRLVVSEKLSRCSKNWAASKTGADILCPIVFRNLNYFLVALYSLRPKSKYCFLAWHVEFSVAPCPAGLHGWSACMMREQFSLFAGRLLGQYLPKVSGGCPTFPAQKSKILRICKMDTWLSLCLLANRSSQQIDLLLIKEMLLETLLFFFSLICLFLLTNKRHNPLFQTAEKEASNCQVWNYAACSVTSRKRHARCFKTYKGESSLYVWI